MSEAKVLNVSAYLFKELPVESLQRLRSRLLARCIQLKLKGTILLTPEGINVCLAGGKAEVYEALDLLAEEGFTDLPIKESYSDSQPFTRMLVRIKKEVIAFGKDEVVPHEHTAPHLPAEELRQWYESGKEMLVLDTRNTYEVKLGKFENAFAFDIETFREFPERVQELKQEWGDKPIVTYCTGGVRCEKAAEYMLQQGFKDVYQLDGGILRYFDHCGGDHYEGDCFVFDKRVALNPQQQTTGATVCYSCREPFQAGEQPQDDVCPHCDKSVRGRRQVA